MFYCSNFATSTATSKLRHFSSPSHFFLILTPKTSPLLYNFTVARRSLATAAASVKRSIVVAVAAPSSSHLSLHQQCRYLTGVVSQARNSNSAGSNSSSSPSEQPPPPQPPGGKVQPWILFIVMVGGLSLGSLFVDRRVRSIAMDALRGTWDYDWDIGWNPMGDAIPRTKGTDAYSRLLDKLQISTSSSRGSSLAETPYQSRKQVILLRHGQYKNVQSTDDDEQGLTDLGQEQSELAGKRLADLLKGKKVRGIYHSDMKRAKETAFIIAKFLPGVPLTEDPGLAEGVPEFPEPPSTVVQFTNLEVDVGRSRISAAYQKYFYRPPSPTSPPAYEDEYDVYDVIVCHGNVIRYFFCRALQFPPRAWLRLATYNCGITWISINNKGFVSAREFGNVGFLHPDKVTYH